MVANMANNYMSGWQQGWHTYAKDTITLYPDSFNVHRDVMIQSFSAWIILRGKTGNVLIDPAVPYCTRKVVLDLLNDVYKCKHGADEDNEIFILEDVLGKACLADYLGAESWLKESCIRHAEAKAKEHFDTIGNTYFEKAEDFVRDLGYLDILSNLLNSESLEKNLEEWKVLLWVRLANSSKEIIIACRDWPKDSKKSQQLEVFVENCLEVLSRPFGELFSFNHFGTTAVLAHSNLRHELHHIESRAQNHIVCHTIDSKGVIRHLWGMGNALHEFYMLHCPNHQHPQTESRVHDSLLGWFWWLHKQYPVGDS